ncbi:hypothetical protein EOM09_07960 [bacterium]|nr:hypothetical protein [bacterium]
MSKTGNSVFIHNNKTGYYLQHDIRFIGEVFNMKYPKYIFKKIEELINSEPDKIIKDLIEKRQGNYCHCLEVNDVYDLQATIENLVDELARKYSKAEILKFFENISIYCLNDENETAVYDFNIADFISELY